MVFATAKALAALFCLAANTMRHEYVVVSAAVTWVVCMGATEPDDGTITRIGVGLTRRFMTVCRKPPEILGVNRIRDSPVVSLADDRSPRSLDDPPDEGRSPC